MLFILYLYDFIESVRSVRRNHISRVFKYLEHMYNKYREEFEKDPFTEVSFQIGNSLKEGLVQKLRDESRKLI